MRLECAPIYPECARIVLNARCIQDAATVHSAHSKDDPNVHSPRIRPVCIQERGPLLMSISQELLLRARANGTFLPAALLHVVPCAVHNAARQRREGPLGPCRRPSKSPNGDAFSKQPPWPCALLRRTTYPAPYDTCDFPVRVGGPLPVRQTSRRRQLAVPRCGGKKIGGQPQRLRVRLLR